MKCDWCGRDAAALYVVPKDYPHACPMTYCACVDMVCGQCQGESEADADIRAGRTKRFETVEGLISDLRRED